MNKPESSVDEWRAKAERLIDDYASTEGLVGLNKKWADIQAHLSAHPSNQVQEPVVWRWRLPQGSSGWCYEHLRPRLYTPDCEIQPLYASPQAVPSEQPIAEQPKSDKANLMVAVGSDLPPALPENPQVVWRAIGEEAECVVQGGRKYLLLSEEMCVRLGGALGM